MKSLITAAALTLALALPAFAQDAKPAIPPVAAPAPAATATPAPATPTPAPVAPAVAAPKAAAPVAAPAAKVEAPKAAAPAVVPPAAAAPKAAAAPAKATPAKADAKAAVKLVNLNTATAAELDALPTIGKARTKAIIAGRPYASVDDLIKKKVLPKNSFDAIKAKVDIK